MVNEGELVLQPGGKRFASNFNVNRMMCAVCGATVFKKIEFGHLDLEYNFVVDYFQYNCVECGSPLPIQYPKPEEKDVKKK